MITQDQRRKKKTVSELERELEEKSAELAQKTHDLQIEASLERVRAVALTMKQPDDVLGICKVMFTELQALGFSDLRNAIINFWDDALGPLRDYDYSDFAGGHIAHIPYNSRPEFEKFRQRISSTTESFAEIKALGEQLESWKERRRIDGEYEDPRLDDIPALYYYFYSTGVGALGISTFSSLSEEKLKVLRRFRNVFDFAYRRYQDIAEAEAHAREAHIEVALERVRSKAMAMQKSDDLNSAVAVVFEELDKLNPGMSRCGIGILNKESLNVDVYTTAVSDQGNTVQVSGDEPMDIHPLLKGAYESWLRQTDFSYVLEGEDLLEYYRALTTTNFRLPDSVQITPAKGVERQYYFNAMFQYGGLFAFRETEFTEEVKSLMKRFASVFNLTYKRFLDIQRAEAQAREAQVEAALERVRAQAMAMHSSEDLAQTIKVFYSQMHLLGVTPRRYGVGLIDKATQEAELTSLNVSGDGTTVERTGQLKLEGHPVLENVYDSWLAQREYHPVLRGEEIKEYYELIAAQISFQNYPHDAVQFGNFFFFPEGVVYAWTEKEFSEEHLRIYRRFTSVLSLAYKRYRDLKLAEARAREAQIEAALERVRGKAMAMQKSEDLGKAIALVFDELDKMNIGTLRCGISIINKEKRTTNIWSTLKTEAGQVVQVSGDESMEIHPLLRGAYDAWLNLQDFSYMLEGKDLHLFYAALANTNFKLPSPGSDASAGQKQYLYVYHFPAGGLYAFKESEFSDEAKNIIRRFGDVFNLTYTRFNDLQIAEAQAREAQIELALERVRARTMAMQRSDEFADTSLVLFQQFNELGVNAEQISIALIHDEEEAVEIFATLHGNKFEKAYKVKIAEQAAIRSLYDAFKSGGKSAVLDLHGKELRDYNAWRNKLRDVKVYDEKVTDQDHWFISGAFFSKGLLSFSTTEPVTVEKMQLLERFAGVFNLTYTRFLDLKQAEAQTREAQIQLALERVRARTMAMQKSEALQEVVHTLFVQLNELGIEFDTVFLIIFTEGSRDTEWWLINNRNQEYTKVKVGYVDQKYLRQLLESKEKEEGFFSMVLPQEEKNEMFSYLFEHTGFRFTPEDQKKRLFALEEISYSVALTKNLAIHLSRYSKKTFSEEENEILRRLTKVFDQAYTRFLDLQKAEAQAREAQIEASLERVRGKAMAMHQSSDLNEAAGTVFTELNKLGINPIRSGFVMLTPNSRKAKLYPATSFDHKSTLALHGEFEFTGHPVYEKQYESWQKQKNYFPVLEGELLKSYYQILSAGLNVPYESFSTDKKQFGSFLPFREGFLFTWSEEPYSEDEINILNRFKSILDLTIRRFIDLQKAEAQAREAQIALALERVRARTLAMLRSDELYDVTELVFQQFQSLTNLTCQSSIGIIHEEKGLAELFTTVQGMVFPIPVTGDLTEPYFMSKMYAAWKAKQKIIIITIAGEDLNRYNEWRNTLANLSPEEIEKELRDDRHKELLKVIQTNRKIFRTDNTAEDKWIIHAALFTHGMISFSTTNPVPEETIQIIERFAGVFDLTYTRFLDLKKAEAQTREAQIEAGLERVRSRTLAMQSSDELAETAAVVFKQLINLGIEPNRLYISIVKDETGDTEFWIIDEDGSKVSSAYTANLNDNPSFLKILEGWKANRKSITIDMQGKELEQYFQHLQKLNVPFKDGLTQQRRVLNIAYFSQGFIGVASSELQPEETVQLLERFAYVFNLTFTRFNDLKIAEAQAREARVEASMERVRSRALAMTEPEELLEVALMLRNEIGIPAVEEMGSCHLFIYDDQSEAAQVGFTRNDRMEPGKVIETRNIFVDLNTTRAGRDFLQFFRSNEEKFSRELNDHEREEWVQYCYSLSLGVENFFDGHFPDKVYNFFRFSNGAIGATSDHELSPESWDLLRRAASVFSLAYSRYKDLSRAREDLKNLMEEKKRSELLLLNILPEEIAAELKQFGKSYARKHDEVTVLFADIKGFSSIAEKLSAQELVTQLDECFRAFDHIVEKHGLEKIKTVGDAYVCSIRAAMFTASPHIS